MTTTDEHIADETDVAETESMSPDAVARAGEPRRAVRIGATALVIVPFVTAVLRAIRNDWFPIGDNALLFIRTRDVWTGDHPFLGSWTSASLSVGENMNNPGAMYDWLVAPFAHLLPPGPAAAIGVALINVAMVVVISAVAHRVGGWSFQRWALLATALMAWSMGSELLIDIWQANALIIAFMALLVISVGVAAGDDALLPLGVAVSSLLLQTHISYAYIFVFVVLATIAVRVWLRRSVDTSAWRRPTVTAVAVGLVLWAPSVWEQLFGSGRGNFTRLLSNSSGGDFALGVSNAAQIVGSLAVRPPFWGRSGYMTTVVVTKIAETPEGPTLTVPGVLSAGLSVFGLGSLVGVLVVLTVLARRRAAFEQVAAGVIAIVVLIGSVLALSRLTIGTVGLSPHHVRWAWPLVAFVHLTIVWLIATEVSVRVRQRHQPSANVRLVANGALVGVIGVVSLLTVPFLAQPSGPTAEYLTLPTMRRIQPALDQLQGFEPVLYDISTLRIYEPFSSTMMMWMQEAGIEFRVDDEGMVRQLGDNRRADGTEPTRIFQLEGAAARRYDGPECVLGMVNALSDDDDAAVTAMIDAAAVDLAAAIGTDVGSARDAIIGREFQVFEPDQQRRVDVWIDTTYALFAEGDVCSTLTPSS